MVAIHTTGFSALSIDRKVSMLFDLRSMILVEYPARLFMCVSINTCRPSTSGAGATAAQSSPTSGGHVGVNLRKFVSLSPNMSPR